MAYASNQELHQKWVRVETGKASHKGMVRPLNEDGIMSLELLFGEGSEDTFFSLYAVADGVGGNEDGEVASKLALRTLTENVAKSLLETHCLNQEFALQKLAEGVEAANSEVYAQSRAKGNGMGTTLAVVLLIDAVAYIANVGDSRVYLLEEEQLRQITTDHSLVAGLAAAGEIAPEEVYTHPQRNIITRCLGTQQDIEVDLFREVLEPGNSLLLCSDGLWEMVRYNEIKDTMLKADNAQATCEQLVELANQNGGLDNISTIVVKVTW